MFLEALLTVASGADAGTKRQALEAARIDCEKRLSHRIDMLPDWHVYAALALIDAFLGRKEEAIREALHAVNLAPKIRLSATLCRLRLRWSTRRPVNQTRRST